MYAQVSSKVLHERYELLELLSEGDSQQPNEVWIGSDETYNEYIVKLWPFHTGEASEIQRALWDAELRVMYRVSSSPGADEALLTIRDAGLDKKHSCFVMVMEAQGASYRRLSDVLPSRTSHSWLATSTIDTRRELWNGLRRIAQGIQLLHEQNVLHRTIGADHVFFHPQIGPSSFRLGGFEWSVRVGELNLGAPPLNWSIPPDTTSPAVSGYRPEDDWYGFGMLAARCLLNVEAHRNAPPQERHRRIMQAIVNASERQLSDLEKTMLRRLIENKRRDRLVRGSDIIAAIDQLIGTLRITYTDMLTNPLILCYNPTYNLLIEAAREAGFNPDPDTPFAGFNPLDLKHCLNLSEFIRKDMVEAQICLVGSIYLLVGRQLILQIAQLRRRDIVSRKEVESWDGAYCISVRDLRWNEGSSTDIPPGLISVRTLNEINKDGTTLGRAQSWERYLPHADKGAALRASLAEFHDFIRCTNQIELLMRDAELFCYQVLRRSKEREIETLVIKETARTHDRQVMDFLQLDGGLVEFLLRERESAKKYCDYVILSSEDGLRFPPGIKPELHECYRVVAIDVQGKQVTLQRISVEVQLQPAPDTGWLRTYGMFGQIDLIRRRKDAIERLENHSYLLRSIYAPGQLFIDTGTVPLSWHIPPDRVDEAKQAVMRDILGTRPIYALHGPPGTGKTTMVAYLLRQIFVDDPVAQVLITAQAHGAVDVLRSRVSEAFSDVRKIEQPLAIRLGRDDTDEETGLNDISSDNGSVSLASNDSNSLSPIYPLSEGSVEWVAVQTLDQAIEALRTAPKLTLMQEKWLECAIAIRGDILSRRQNHDATEFRELIKRGANITYCTTSAGDLEELALGTQSFDWSIIEEAGKCHGFDLALPLQPGHRWLLIGDDKQLPPYRLEDYQKALFNLEGVVYGLGRLPRDAGRAGRLLDDDWIRRWNTWDEDERIRFKQLALYWLTTFQRIRERCLEVRKEQTIDRPIGAAAGMLSLQYRMHPTIGTLISEAYYDRKLTNRTVQEDGEPAEWVTLQISDPKAIQGVAIVWLDTPSASISDVAREHGPVERQPRYTNPYEAEVIKGFLSQLALDPVSGQGHREAILTNNPVKLAVLSPYNQQVRLIQKKLAGIELPAGIRLKEALRSRRSQQIDAVRMAHTVDSFQGNEADIVIVSLVRNNLGQGEHPLGFLLVPSRMNVLLSRAQRLLVLVGSWDFFSKQVEPFSIEDDTRSEWHLKKVITLLADWFATGKAIKLDAQAFVEESR